MSKNLQKKSAITAITNASIYNPSTSKFDILNFALKNNICIAKGYLPDDEEMTELNAKDHIIIQNPFNFGPFLAQTTTPSSHPDYPHITLLPEGHLIKELTQPEQSPLTSHYVTKVSFTEFQYLLQEQAKLSTSTHTHLMLSSLTPDNLNQLPSVTLPKHISLGLYIDQNAKKHAALLKKAIETKTIVSLATETPSTFQSTLIDLFQEHAFSVCHLLFSSYAKSIFNIPFTQLTLTKKPTVWLVKKDPPYTLLNTIIKGALQ